MATRGRVRDADRMSATGQLREATEDDLDAVLDLVVLSDLAELGEATTTIEEVRTGLATDSAGAVVEDDSGRLVGYAWVDHEPGHATMVGDITLRPGVEEPAAEMLLGWLRAKAHEIGPDVALHTFTDSTNLTKRRLYEAAGATLIRRYFRMEVRFETGPPLPVPELGEGIEIRGVARTDADLRAMHEVVDVAFLDHFGHERGSYETWLRRIPEGSASDLSLWWIATVAGEPAAGLYGSVIPGAGYVDTLGTLRAHRRKGLARALLLTSFAEFHRRGLPKVLLGVDATNPTGALGLYESAGMKVAHEGWRYEVPTAATA